MGGTSPGMGTRPVAGYNYGAPISLLSVRSLRLFIRGRESRILFPRLPSGCLLEAVGTVAATVVKETSAGTAPAGVVS